MTNALAMSLCLQDTTTVAATHRDEQTVANIRAWLSRPAKANIQG